MATNIGVLTVDVELGPVLKAGLDVLEYAGDMLEYISAKQAAEREELMRRCYALRDALKNFKAGEAVGPEEERGYQPTRGDAPPKDGGDTSANGADPPLTETGLLIRD